MSLALSYDGRANKVQNNSFTPIKDTGDASGQNLLCRNSIMYHEKQNGWPLPQMRRK